MENQSNMPLTEVWYYYKDQIRDFYLDEENPVPLSYTAVVKNLLDKLRPTLPFKVGEMVILEDGDCQGTFNFVVPLNLLDELWVHMSVSYGSCEACDTFSGALWASREDDDENGQRVYNREILADRMMTLSLHLAQSARFVVSPDFDDRETWGHRINAN